MLSFKSSLVKSSVLAATCASTDTCTEPEGTEVEWECPLVF